jgi:hypothetical protein
MEAGYDTDLDVERLKVRVNGELWRLSTKEDPPRFKSAGRGLYRLIR